MGDILFALIAVIKTTAGSIS